MNDGYSHTLKWWKSNLENTFILQMLLFAERTGDCGLHVFISKRMITILHAAGHIREKFEYLCAATG